MVGVALDKLRDLLDSDDPAIVTRVAQDIVSRVNGTPVTTNIVHASLATAEVRKLTADDVQAAARQYLLRQGAALAEEVVAIEQGEPVEQEP